jgi:hypothetical protein
VLKRLAGMIGAAVIAGCGSSPPPAPPVPCCTASDIVISETVPIIGAARIIVDINPHDKASSWRHSPHHALEAGIAGAKGEDKQQLAGSQPPVIFGSQRFNGPAELTHEFGFYLADLSYRYRHMFAVRRGRIGPEVMVGVAKAHLDLTVSSGMQSAREAIAKSGFLVGAGGMWNFLPAASLHGRFSRFIGEEERSEQIERASRGDIHLVYALGSHAALRAGWAWWDVRARTNPNSFSPTNRSVIRLEFSGPVLGLDLMF